MDLRHGEDGFSESSHCRAGLPLTPTPAVVHEPHGNRLTKPSIPAAVCSATDPGGMVGAEVMSPRPYCHGHSIRGKEKRKSSKP